MRRRSLRNQYVRRNRRSGKKIPSDDSAGAQIQRKRENNRHRVRLAESSRGLFEEKGRDFGHGREVQG